MILMSANELSRVPFDRRTDETGMETDEILHGFS